MSLFHRNSRDDEPLATWPAPAKRALRAMDRALGFKDQPAATTAIDGLQRWVCSLPWVCELPVAEHGDGGARYAVDCPPLGAHGVWLYLRPRPSADGAPPEVQVVLPADIAVQATRGGWGVPMAHVADDLVVVSVAVPGTERNVSALQALFVLAYDAAFTAGGR